MFGLAANQRNTDGQFNYAIACLPHLESEVDGVGASGDWNLSADYRLVMGRVNYGVCALGRFGVGVDLCEAAIYYTKASCQADAVGSFNFGVRLLGGKEFQWMNAQLSNVLTLWRRSKTFVVL
jgi:hypothetical protein